MTNYAMIAQRGKHHAALCRCMDANSLKTPSTSGA